MTPPGEHDADYRRNSAQTVSQVTIGSKMWAPVMACPPLQYCEWAAGLRGWEKRQ